MNCPYDFAHRKALYGVTRFALLITILVAALAAIGCRPAAYQLQVYKIGLVAPLSGEGFTEGYRWLYAARQAVSEWNVSSSQPYRLELVAYDESDGAAVARRLAQDSAVLGVLGHWRDEVALASLPAYKEAGLPLLTVGVTGEDLTRDAGGLVWRMIPSKKMLTRGASLFVAQRKPGATTAVVAGPAIRDLTAAEATRENATAQGLRVVRAEAALPYTSGYDDILTRVDAAAPDAVFFSGSIAATETFAGQFATGVRKSTLLLTPHLGVPEMLDFPASVDGLQMYWVSGADRPEASEAGRAFAGAYLERWKDRASPLTVVAYDAARLLLRSIQGAGAHPDRAAVAAAIKRSGGFRGLGEYSFTSQGELANPQAYIFRVEKGRFPGELAARFSVGASAATASR